MVSGVKGDKGVDSGEVIDTGRLTCVYVAPNLQVFFSFLYRQYLRALINGYGRGLKRHRRDINI